MTLHLPETPEAWALILGPSLLLIGAAGAILWWFG